MPQVFYFGDMISLSTVAEKLNLNIPEVLFSCLPCLQALIFSDCALNQNRSDTSKYEQILLSSIPEDVSSSIT